MKYGEKSGKDYPQEFGPSYYMLIGVALSKIDFWANRRYDISFQFWGEANNNAYVRRDSVDVADFGGEDTPLAIMVRVLEWCEKANPRIKYPDQLTISNVQP